MLLHIAQAFGAGLYQTFEMAWATLWAMALGFFLSGMVQAFVSKAELRRVLGDRSPWSLLRATGFGAASSSCSYAASAMAKSLFEKGADFVAAMVFMFASTNLVIELGVVLAVLIGWQFTASEFVGGLFMIALLALVTRVTVPDRLVERARQRLASRGGEQEISGFACVRPTDESFAGKTAEEPWGLRLRSRARWRDAATYAVADLTMLRKEIAIGFVAAGFLAALVPAAAWQAVFLSGHGIWSSLENAAIGPLIAMLSFVCSVGNVPLAAALWKGGISFGGVVSFIFADLITLPLLLIYRRFYGIQLTLRMLLSFWLVMSVAGFTTGLLFEAIGAVPGFRPTQIAQGVFAWNYTTALDVLALLLLVGMFWWSRQPRESSERLAIDPICGMQVEKATAPATVVRDGQTTYFCSDRCRDRLLSSETAETDSASPPAEEPAPMAVDPICGMQVEKATAPATVVRDGQTIYFCSDRCRDRFLSSETAGTDSGSPPPKEPAPMAVDPICGMQVDTDHPGATVTLADGSIRYFCCEGCAGKFSAQLEVGLGSSPAHGAPG